MHVLRRVGTLEDVPFLVLAAVLLVPLAIVALMPLLLIQRYRAGTARRLARAWTATLNAIAMSFSVALFLFGAAITNFWVPHAFSYAADGLAAGCLLGVVGLWLSRWEATPRSLHYTPNRWLVLAISLVVASRVLYGFWRGWMTVRAGIGETSWAAAFGVAGSLAAGAIVLGYYFAYGIGVRWRISKWQKGSLRVM